MVNLFTKLQIKQKDRNRTFAISLRMFRFLLRTEFCITVSLNPDVKCSKLRMIIAFLASLRCHNNCYANDGLQLLVRFLACAPLFTNSAPHHTIDNCSKIIKKFKILLNIPIFCCAILKTRAKVVTK